MPEATFVALGIGMAALILSVMGIRASSRYELPPQLWAVIFFGLCVGFSATPYAIFNVYDHFEEKACE
jgi:hypothetical protein